MTIEITYFLHDEKDLIKAIPHIAQLSKIGVVTLHIDDQDYIAYAKQYRDSNAPIADNALITVDEPIADSAPIAEPVAETKITPEVKLPPPSRPALCRKKPVKSQKICLNCEKEFIGTGLNCSKKCSNTMWRKKNPDYDKLKPKSVKASDPAPIPVSGSSPDHRPVVDPAKKKLLDEKLEKIKKDIPIRRSPPAYIHEIF